MARTAINDLPTFTGRNDECTFTDWIALAQDAFLEDDINDEARKLACLRRRVEGQARVEIDLHRLQESLTAEEKTRVGWTAITTVAEFTTYFNPKFAALAVDDNVRDRLRNLKQTGSVSEYITAETRIVGSYKMEDSERRYDFINGLQVKVQEYVRSQEPKTFVDVITAALKYERIKGGQTVSSTSTATTASATEPMDVDAIQFVADAPNTAVNKSELMIPMSQLQQAMEMAAMTMGWNTKSPHEPRPHQRQHQDRSLTLCINGYDMQVNTRQPWVRQYLRDSNLCYRCGSSKHQARQCPKGKEPGQQ
ncbi:hypothetical protein H4S07_002675 [Coemansia furcata]|uniref:Uncharacterized protein n=1 Tax=Coemansia furcata TaxID=417177 RepID=A0ACC1LJE7_9FUNG|nr:hypothetical protein H4S07_002675 [Coemansia furcata]